MSKTTMTVFYCVLITLLIVALIWGIGWGWEGAGLGFFHGSFSHANLETAAHYEVEAADVSELRLSLSSEQLRVEPTDGDNIVVDQSSRSELTERDIIRCGTEGGALMIESGSFKRSGCMGWNIPQSSVTIHVPEGLLLNADLSTLSGTVAVEQLEFGEFSVSTASGRVDLTGVRARECDVETLSGDINVMEGAYVNLTCEAASGSISAQADADEQVDLSTLSGRQDFEGKCEIFESDSASGDVRARLDGAPEEINTEAMSGSVELICADVSQLRTINADSASGSVSIALPEGSSVAIDFESASGNLRTEDAPGLQLGGPGAIEVSVDTASGDLIITNV